MRSHIIYTDTEPTALTDPYENRLYTKSQPTQEDIIDAAKIVLASNIFKNQRQMLMIRAYNKIDLFLFSYGSKVSERHTIDEWHQLVSN